MTEIILNNLFVDHVLRNTKLQGMFHRQKGTKAWKEINGNYGIRNVTFNQLSKDVWQDTTEFAWIGKSENEFFRKGKEIAKAIDANDGCIDKTILNEHND